MLAIAAGAIVANIYYPQLLLPAMALDLGASDQAMGAVPMATQLGFGAGMIMLAPLGDRLERRGLIFAMTALSSMVLVGVGLARGLGTLIAASFLLGLASMVPQVIVPYAATASPAEVRGRGIVRTFVFACVRVDEGAVARPPSPRAPVRPCKRYGPESSLGVAV